MKYIGFWFLFGLIGAYVCAAARAKRPDIEDPAKSDIMVACIICGPFSLIIGVLGLTWKGFWH